MLHWVRLVANLLRCSSYAFEANWHQLLSSILSWFFWNCPLARRWSQEYLIRRLRSESIQFINGKRWLRYNIHYIDPWKWVSLRQSKGNIISRVANCTDCGHCVDLYTPLTSDSNELKKIRDEQFLTISEWIETYWQSVKTVNPNSWSEKLEKITFQSVKSIPILKNILTHE